MTNEMIETIAKRHMELYAKYSQEPIAIDRLLPECRVSWTDLKWEFPELNVFDYWELVMPRVLKLKKKGRMK